MFVIRKSVLTDIRASVDASPDIIHVPSDYAKIQWAVGNASAGDTIIVSAGVYYEHVTIDKSLIIKGENGNTIIDGNGTGHVVSILANNVNITGFTIQNSGPNFWDSAIYTHNASWCSISHNILIYSGHGIWLDWYSDNNILTGNNVSYNLVGIGISTSRNNIVTSNYVFSSVHCGIGLSSASNNNIIANNLAKNNEYGVWLDYTTNVIVTRNTVTDNLHGISLDHSDNNTIFHNNIINNTQQTRIINSTSTWDSDYEGLDANQDGIGDSPRIINANNIDNHPLMGPFSDFTINWNEKLHHVTTICNSAISDFQFNGTAIFFNVTCEDGTVGFCRIRIPTALMYGNFTVYLDGVNTLYTLLPRSNTTHNYLYFTYMHSTNEVAIIANFSSTTILPTPMLLIVLAIIYIVKKQRQHVIP